VTNYTVSHPILIDDFVGWMRDRYGLVIMPNWQNATIEDNKSFNANINNLKHRLREIGFYTDLSDPAPTIWYGGVQEQQYAVCPRPYASRT
jgi:hypothetical protein